MMDLRLNRLMGYSGVKYNRLKSKEPSCALVLSLVATAIATLQADFCYKFPCLLQGVVYTQAPGSFK